MRLRKERRFPPKDMLKHLKSPKVLLIAAAVLFIVFAGLAIDAVITPNKIEEKVIGNKIQEKTNFDYKIEVEPCILYPAGGIISPEGSIIPKITKSIRLTLNSNITSERPITVKGTQKVTFMLIADKLWQREYVLSQEKPFEMNGTENKIVQNEYAINLQELYAFMEKVQKETGANPERYYIKLKPEVKGNIIYEGREIPIDTVPEIAFETGASLIKLQEDEKNKQGEKNKVEEKKVNGKEFKKETPIEKINTIYPDYSLLGMKFPVVAARYLFSLIASLFLLLIIYSIYKLKPVIRLPERKVLSEAEQIDKKYKSRIILMQGVINTEGKSVFTVESFKSLINLADDRELPVIRIKQDDNSAAYHIADGNNIFVYHANAKPVSMPAPQMKIFSILGK